MLVSAVKAEHSRGGAGAYSLAPPTPAAAADDHALYAPSTAPEASVWDPLGDLLEPQALSPCVPPALVPPAPLPTAITSTTSSSNLAEEGALPAWWSAELERELAELYRRVGAAAGVTFTRELSASDMCFIAEACTGELASADGARAWVSRTATELAKVARLWNASRPRLIAGLVPRTRADAVLRTAPPGTFIVRLSSGEPGELVVAFALDSAPFGPRTEQCYLRQDGEALDERVVTERILANRVLSQALDCDTGTLFSKDLFRPRGRYAELANATSSTPCSSAASSAAPSPPFH